MCVYTPCEVMHNIVNNNTHNNYVTRFAKQLNGSGLIHAQFQDTLFIAICMLAISMHQQGMCLLLLKVEQSAFT